jgi:hypothetical protein
MNRLYETVWNGLACIGAVSLAGATVPLCIGLHHVLRWMLTP